MKKYILIIIAIILVILFVLYIGFNIQPGSYVFSKKYEFKLSESTLIESIHKLKQLDSSLVVPEDYQTKEGRREDRHWYYFYVFDSNKERVYFCWVRSKTNSITTLALVSIREPTGKWKVFGRDFTKEEEKLEIKEFENKFLNELKKMVNSEGN